MEQEQLDIHCEIKAKLNMFVEKGQVPHLIFHGPSGGGKRTLVHWFLDRVYCGNRTKMQEYIMYVDCAHGKGIKFIREQVKFFAKTNLNINRDCPFKAIVLSNADKLTTDAQSALRRLIEVFSHNTRFIVIVEDKYKLLLPILSRLSDVYVSLPLLKGEETNLHKYTLEGLIGNVDTNRDRKIKSIIKKHSSGKNITFDSIVRIADECFENAIHSNDIISFVSKSIPIEKRSKLLLLFDKIQPQYRSEAMLMATILHIGLVRCDHTIDNIGFM